MADMWSLESECCRMDNRNYYWSNHNDCCDYDYGDDFVGYLQYLVATAAMDAHQTDSLTIFKKKEEK